jgi:hypothetical protein
MRNLLEAAADVRETAGQIAYVALLNKQFNIQLTGEANESGEIKQIAG